MNMIWKQMNLLAITFTTNVSLIHSLYKWNKVKAHITVDWCAMFCLKLAPVAIAAKWSAIGIARKWGMT